MLKSISDFLDLDWNSLTCLEQYRIQVPIRVVLFLYRRYQWSTVGSMVKMIKMLQINMKQITDFNHDEWK